MKKLLYLLTGLCLLAGLFAGCEKPLEETGGSNGGSVSGGDGITTLEGIVTSKDTQKPLLLASVTLLPTDKLTLTDTAGSFRFRDIAAGTYRLQVKRAGYATYTSGDIKVAAGKTVQYHIALEEERSDLQIQNSYGEVIDELQIEDDATQGTFVLKNTGTKIIEWEIPKLAVDWISDFSMQSGKLAPGASDIIEFSINRSNLSDGINETTLYIGSSVGDKELLIKVGVERSFSLLDEAGEEISELDLSGMDSYDFMIKNTGNDVLTWSVGDIESDWLTFVGKTDGKLEVEESDRRTLRVNLERLKESGTYETTLLFRSNAGERTVPVKIKIEMNVRMEDLYGSEITEVEFGSASSKKFRIRNTGNGILNWEIPSVAVDWLTLSKSRGSLQPGATETVSVTVYRDLLSADNQTIIKINTNAGNKQLDVSVQVELSYQLVNVQGMEISELNLGREPSETFGIKNTGNGVLKVEVSPSNVDWLRVSGVGTGSAALIGPGAEGQVFVSIDMSKTAEGDNETVLSIHTNIEGGDKQLPVRYLKHIGAVGSDYVETVAGIELPMVAVQGGIFTMGATAEQGSDAADKESPAHQVLLDGFYIGKYEITRAQWKAVMGDNITSDDKPYLASWNEAVQFCAKLSQMTGRTYRLPTEAEWEYAARGGQNPDGTKYAGSNTVGHVAWYNGNSSQTQPVGTKQPNGLGVYDMSGNVYEWCSDWYGLYSGSPAVNPLGPSSGTYRVLRGGNWVHDASTCRVSHRSADVPNQVFNNVGFRIVCEQ